MSGSGEVWGIGIIGGGGIWGIQKTTEKVPPLVVGSDQPLVELGPPLVELDCSHQPYVPSNWQLMLLFLPIASAANSSSRVLLAGGGTLMWRQHPLLRP